MASRIESAEQIRVQNETSRQAKELERIAAETQRLVKEQDRIESESIRIENENQRIDDENERKQAEQRRVVSEINRVNEEKGRQTNETVRNSSESNRLSNENARKEAESNRVTAENARVTAEAKRQTDTSNAVERATTAAERCEEFVEELDGKVNVSDVDSELSATSTNPIQNKAVYEALQNIDVSGGGDTLPIGIIVPYASDTAPDGWLLCDGTAVSRTEYSELFDVIGESYGAGDGVTTFALPNEPNPLAYTKSNNAIQFLERSPELYTIIKAKQSTPLEGNVVNSLASNSETDAPSIKAVNDVLNALYPVGTILEFDCEMDMTSIYGGTWELFGVGRSTVCINTSDTDFNIRLKTGGSKTHTMTVAEMPAHNHVANSGAAKVLGSSIRVCKGTYTSDSAENKANNHAPATPNTVINYRDATANSSEIPGGNHHHDIAVGNTGSGSLMNIMNPYIVVYRYRKTARR
ncbi:MAG: hypothetical protein HFF02_06840 [Erysipelotrichaceae bacterium]|nr:hypothetical protein [Erysipelotrichaceae bacterium]